MAEKFMILKATSRAVLLAVNKGKWNLMAGNRHDGPYLHIWPLNDESPSTPVLVWDSLGIRVVYHWDQQSNTLPIEVVRALPTLPHYLAANIAEDYDNSDIRPTVSKINKLASLFGFEETSLQLIHNIMVGQ